MMLIQRFCFYDGIAFLFLWNIYGTGSSMINNTFVNTAISVIKAQHISTMISIFSNVLSGVLGAVADKGKYEKSSDESAQSESNDSSSSLE